MARVIPSLFKLIGDGFVDDAYATDGNHLRWMFDPRLGFPRHAICLERRPGIGSPEGNQGLETFDTTLTASPAETVDRIVQPAAAVSRPGGKMMVTPTGIILDRRPVVLDFHGGSGAAAEPYACGVRLAFKVLVPGGRIVAAALYDNVGKDEVVDQRVRVYSEKAGEMPGLRPDDREAILRALTEALRVMDLVRNPVVGPLRPKLVTKSQQQLYVKLLRLNRSAYEFVTQAYLNAIIVALERQRLKVSDLLPKEGLFKTVFMDLRAERIDRVAVVGDRARLLGAEWIRSEDLIRADGWEVVDCYPIATGEDDYFARNVPHFDGLAPEEMAEMRVLDPLPHGAEPLDDPQVPPSRLPEPDELVKRYLNPWRQRLEEWVRTVLGESLGGAIHQAEVAVSSKLTDAGQVSGDGMPEGLVAAIEAAGADVGDATMDLHPYGLLLAASCAFPMARLLGLAAIDRPPVDKGLWDYRVRGQWLIEDLRAWVGRLRRERNALCAAQKTAPPAERAALEQRILELAFEEDTTSLFIQNHIGAAVAGPFQLWALKVGVRATEHDLPRAPARLTAIHDGLGMPPDDPRDDPEAVARLEWPLRQRDRVAFDEEIPLGAVLARGPAGVPGPFSRVLNPEHPDFGIRGPIIPADPGEDADDGRVAVFHDRHVRDGEHYRYGVSEGDPFGRWSRFTETTHRWDYNIPPVTPTQIGAELAEADTPPALELTVRFLWPTQLRRLVGYSFSIHLRRIAPPQDRPRDLNEWPFLERQAGTGEDPYGFASTFTGADLHDGMEVNVSSRVRTETDPRPEFDDVYEYREYTVTFSGLIVDRDAIDRAQVWVAVSVQDTLHGQDSDDVSVPARAEHVLATPPPPPALPPDPEQATYADAEGVSSYTLRWEGTADLRYVVYRTGERELVKLLQDTGVDTSADPFRYDHSDEANFRAEALKRLAALPAARDAFQPRSQLVPEPPFDLETGAYQEPIDWPSLPSGSRSFTDELPGQLRTLSVYTVLGRSRAGVLSAWPLAEGSFVVVEVPHAPEPARPVVLRSGWQPPVLGGGNDGQVELLIAEPLKKMVPVEGGDPIEVQVSAPVASYEVYRTLDPAKTHDYRRMRPLQRLDSPVYDPDVSGVAVPAATYVDADIQPWRSYFYRVVARAPGLDGAPLGMRSESSALIQVSTLSGSPPPAPTVISSVRIGGQVLVRFQADVPATPAGESVFQILHLVDPLAPPVVVARSTASAALQMPPDQYAIEVETEGLVHKLLAGEEIKVRVTDPVGQQAESSSATVT